MIIDPGCQPDKIWDQLKPKLLDSPGRDFLNQIGAGRPSLHVSITYWWQTTQKDVEEEDMLLDAFLNGDFIYLLLLCFFADIRTNWPGLPILSEDQKLSKNSPSCQRQIAAAETTNHRPEKLLRILNLSCKRWLLDGFPDHVSISETNRSLLVYISSSQVCSSNAAVLNPYNASIL